MTSDPNFDTSAKSSMTSSVYSSSSFVSSDQSGQGVGPVNIRDMLVGDKAVGSLSPIDLEILIQTERLTTIIDELIYKTKMAICLPFLIREYNFLHNTLSDEHENDLLLIFEQYEKPKAAILLNETAIEDIRNGFINLKNRLSPELSHMMHILSKYSQLKPKVEEMFEVIQELYADCEQIPPNIVYLAELMLFKRVMVNEMTITAAEKLKQIIRFRKLNDSNETLKQEILELEHTKTLEQDIYEKEMKMKQAKIKNLEEELKLLRYDCDIGIDKIVLDTERQMVLATRSHVIKIEMLRESANEMSENYNNVLASHLKEEKALRTRRFKVQGQLVSWLQKYDTEMSDKHAELDQMEKNLQDETDKVEKLEVDYAEQDLVYLPLMEERNAEYEAEMESKMQVFLRDHSARILQHAWRSVLNIRAEKKRLKKLMKKLQKEQEAEKKKK